MQGIHLTLTQQLHWNLKCRPSISQCISRPNFSTVNVWTARGRTFETPSNLLISVSLWLVVNYTTIGYIRKCSKGMAITVILFPCPYFNSIGMEDSQTSSSSSGFIAEEVENAPGEPDIPEEHEAGNIHQSHRGRAKGKGQFRKARQQVHTRKMQSCNMGLSRIEYLRDPIPMVCSNGKWTCQVHWWSQSVLKITPQG